MVSQTCSLFFSFLNQANASSAHVYKSMFKYLNILRFQSIRRPQFIKSTSNMATNADFNDMTEASAVTKAFATQIAGKIVLVTGVNAGGLGGSTISALAGHSPKMLIMTGRSQAKVDEVTRKLQPIHPSVTFRFLQLELSSQRSVRAAAEQLLAFPDVPQLDLLINNAGVMSIPERTLSEDGLEMHFATNHIGHFLFTNLILSKLKAASSNSPKGSTRIINVSSRGVHYSPVRFSDHNFTKSLSQLPDSDRPNVEHLKNMNVTSAESDIYIPSIAYGQSKTANVLFSLFLTQHLYQSHGILSFGLHPGGILTELTRYSDPAQLEKGIAGYKAAGLRFKTLSQGASTTLVAALDPKLAPARDNGDGVYLSDCQIAEPAAWARDPIAAERLWALSEELVGEKFTLQ